MIAPDINFEYCRASGMKRLANYLIDLIAFYILVLFLGFFSEILFPGSISEMNLNPIMDRVITIFIYGLIMFIIEIASNGKSLGKVITGTRAMTYDGERLNFGQALIRNFVRAVPFNALSGVGSPCSPWHDTWSHTLVIDEKKLELAKRQDEFYSSLKNQDDIE